MKYLRFILLLLFMSVSCFAAETIKISALTDGSSSVTTGTWLVGTIVDTTYKFSASSLVGLYLGTLTNDKYCKYNSATSKIDCIYSSSGLGDDNTWTGTNTFSSSVVFSDALNISAATVSWPATITTTTFVGALTGKADTATALADNPTDCSANQFATTIAANGNLTCAALTDADVPDTITASNYLPLAGGTLTGSTSITKVNAAGGSADALTLSGTLGEMDGSDIFRGIYIGYINAASHTGTDYVNGIAIADLVATDATEQAIYVGSGWDYGVDSRSPVKISGDGSTTKGLLYLDDLDNSAYVAITPADETTSYTITLPAAVPTTSGQLAKFTDAGVMSFTDELTSITIGGGTASRNAEWDGSGNLTSSDTATTGTGAPVKATSPSFTTSILPVSNANIGSATAEWGNVYLKDGAVIYGQADQSNTLTSSATGWTANLNLTVTGTISGGTLTPVIGDADVFDDNCTGSCLYGGTFIVSAAGTVILPNATAGMNFTIVLEDAVATVIEPLATGTDDTIVLNGTALAQGHNITSSTKGAMCVFQYRAADSWMATCNGFVDGT